MSPHVTIELLLARTSEDAADLTSRDLLHGPELRRNPVQLRRLFQRESRDHRVFNRISAHGDTVVLEHERHAVADGVTHHAAALRGVDLPVEIEDRNLRREDGATATNWKNVDTRDTERGRIGGMRMYHGCDVGSRL